MNNSINTHEIESLYQQFRKPLFRFIQSKIADTHLAQEILNDVFFKASTSLHTLKEKTKIQSWLYKIASNLIIDHYRKRKEHYIDIKEFHTKEEQEEFVGQDMSCCFKEFLTKLPSSYAQSLQAVYLDELTQKEYAQQNDLNLSTVKSNIKRGKASMQKFFEQCCAFEKDKYNNIIKCTPYNKEQECD